MSFIGKQEAECRTYGKKKKVILNYSMNNRKFTDTNKCNKCAGEGILVMFRDMDLPEMRLCVNCGEAIHFVDEKNMIPFFNRCIKCNHEMILTQDNGVQVCENCKFVINFR